MREQCAARTQRHEATTRRVRDSRPRRPASLPGTHAFRNRGLLRDSSFGRRTPIESLVDPALGTRTDTFRKQPSGVDTDQYSRSDARPSRVSAHPQLIVCISCTRHPDTPTIVYRLPCPILQPVVERETTDAITDGTRHQTNQKMTPPGKCPLLGRPGYSVPSFAPSTEDVSTAAPASITVGR